MKLWAAGVWAEAWGACVVVVAVVACAGGSKSLILFLGAMF